MRPAGESRVLAAEALGTFTMVFAGTGAIVIDQVSGGRITHVGIALVFGLVVMAMIQTFGDVSGAHMNPAVTLAFRAAGRIGSRTAAGYIAAQLAGALAASGLLRLLFPEDVFLGGTQPAGSVLQSFVLEVVLSFVLMLVILAVSTGSKERGLLAGLTIGGVVTLEALFAGPICGASMNPARSLAPALVSLHLENAWIYLAAPLVGMLLALPACRLTGAPDCCTEPCS
ncbi:MAG: aquaporin [Planctomycetes bacterium]|nr:aquaporin [Planctomycetota bacterium]